MSNAYVTREQVEAIVRTLIKRIDSAGQASAHASTHESGGGDEVDHDQLSGYVGAEHVDHSGVTLTAGVGLSGGGTIEANRTFDLDLNDLTEESGITSGDFIPFYDTTAGAHRKVDFDDFGGGSHGSTHHSGGGDEVDHDSLSGFVSNEHINWTNATQDFKTSGYVQSDDGDSIRMQHGSPVYGVCIGASSGGWSRSFGFMNNALSVRYGGFGGTGSGDSLTNLWIGEEYDKVTMRIYADGLSGSNVEFNPQITSGNPSVYFYGWDTGASGLKYLRARVAGDGTGWLISEEGLVLQSGTGFVDISPNNGNWGLLVRKHDDSGGRGWPYLNVFVQDAGTDYVNFVMSTTGSTLGLTIDTNNNVGINQVPTSGYRIDANGKIRGSVLESDVSTGTAPLTVTSTTKVSNLNVDRLDGYHSTAFPQIVWKSTPADKAGSMTFNNTWRNIDLTSDTSSNATYVIIAVALRITQNGHYARLWFNEYNDTTQYNAYFGVGGDADARNGGQCIVKLDSSQRINYKGWKSAYGYIDDVYVVGYIEEK
jgi:hypothetical protein